MTQLLIIHLVSAAASIIVALAAAAYNAVNGQYRGLLFWAPVALTAATVTTGFGLIADGGGNITVFCLEGLVLITLVSAVSFWTRSHKPASR